LTKISNLEERVHRLNQTEAVIPPLPPNSQCLIGKLVIRALLICDHEDKSSSVEATNEELEKLIAEGGGEKWCNNPAAVESLRLRRWFIDHDKLENLIPRLCYTTEISQVDRDIANQEQKLETNRKVIA